MKPALTKQFSKDLELNYLIFRTPVSEILEQIYDLNPDGLILENIPGHTTILSNLSIPTVALNAILPLPQCSSVSIDFETVGHCAGDFFTNRAFKRFAFVGIKRSDNEALKTAFTQSLRLADKNKLNTYTMPAARSPLDHTAEIDVELQTWLKSLPKPIALFATEDRIGRKICAMAEAANLSVPNDIAVLAFGNDSTLCNFSRPPLSSIPIPWNQMLNQCFDSLNNLLEAPEMPPHTTKISPLPVHIRQSSEAIPVENQPTKQALKWLREHAHESVDINELCDQLSVNRRTLEKLFKKHLHRSPRQELELIRIQRAKHLLANTDMPLALIAEASGFSTPPHLASAFNRVEGITPSSFRKAHED